VPVLFDILAFTLFALGVAAFFWGRSKQGNTFIKGRGTGTGGRRGINVLTSVTAILPVAWLFLVWTSISTAPASHSPIRTPTPVITNRTSTPTFINPHVLTIGTSFNVLSQTANKEQPEGFDIELATEIAQNMGLAPKFVDSTNEVSSNALLANLQDKQYDVTISAIRVTEASKKQADFVPYLNVGESLLVASNNPKPLRLIKDITNLCQPLPGMNISVRDNTTALIDLQNGKKKCKDGTDFQIIPESSTPNAVQDLLGQKVVAVFEDATTTDYYVNKKVQDDKLALGGNVINEVTEGIAVRKGDEKMLESIKSALSKIKRTGMYDTLIKKWGFSSNEQLM
jgi:polar amino acid transport system substrate-binding protein